MDHFSICLHLKITNLKKEVISNDGTIQRLKHKCHCSSQAEKYKLLKHSKVAMKSHQKSDKLLYNVDKCKMMIQNTMLRKGINDLKAKIDALELEQNRLQTIDQKCVSTKSDAKTYTQHCLSKSCLFFFLFGISSTIDQHMPCCNLLLFKNLEVKQQTIFQILPQLVILPMNLVISVIFKWEISCTPIITSHSLGILSQWMEIILMKHTLLFQEHHLHHMC